MDRVRRIWYLSPMRAAKVQASLRIRAVSPEPSLLAHTSSESRGTFRQKARSLAPSEWLGMRSWNLSWRNARRHKFACRGPIMIFSATVVCAILERISGFDLSLQMTDHRHLKFSTASSLWCFILISLWKQFGLFVTTFVLSGAISILYLGGCIETFYH